MRARKFISVALLAFPLPTLAQSISINGATATSVSSAPGGAVQITIAPPDARGVSQNGFSRFDVKQAGASFDNQGRGASAIVAEVTGTTRSRINGTLSVLGDRADVVLANPNGISLNGARFENMRGLALIAGQRAGGTALTYTLSGADIDVGADGLTANLRRLDLVARSLSINGTVREDAATPFVQIGLHAGPGAVQINPQAFAVDDDDYLTLTDRGGAQDAVSLTISSGAILAGGRVTLTADGRGAGVRMAGEALAAAGAFRLSADGAVTLDGARITSQGDSNINGAQITASGGAVRSNAGSVGLTAAQSAILDRTDLSGMAALSVTAGRALVFQNLTASFDGAMSLGSGAALTVLGAGMTARDTVTIAAASAELVSTETTRTTVQSLSAAVDADIAGAFSVQGALLQGASMAARAGSLQIATTSATAIGAVVATTGNLALTIAGDVTNRSGRILAQGDLALSAGGNLSNLVAKTPAAVAQTGGRGLLGGRTTTTFAAGNHAFGQEVGQIGATGNATLTVAGAIDNTGGQISGAEVTLQARTIVNQVERFGTVTVARRCILFFCRGSVKGSFGFDGGSIQATGALRLAASAGFDSVGGILRGDTGIALDGPAFRFRALTYASAYQRPGGFGGLFGGAQARTFTTDEPGLIASAGGSFTISPDSFISIQGVPFEPATLIDLSLIDDYSDETPGLAAQNRNPIGFFAGVLD